MESSANPFLHVSADILRSSLVSAELRLQTFFFLAMNNSLAFGLFRRYIRRKDYTFYSLSKVPALDYLFALA